MKNVKREYPEKKIRYIHCGEYTKAGNPHYHAILFGVDFDDKVFLTQRTKGGTTYRIYTSKKCEKAWGKGFITIGEANIHTAGYIGKYCYKKIGSKIELAGKKPVYATMSRRPGIGRSWYEKYKTDVYPSDECRTIDGKVMRPPRYYDERLKQEDIRTYNLIKKKRMEAGRCLKPTEINGFTLLLSDNDAIRLKTKELCKIEKMSKNERSLENEI